MKILTTIVEFIIKVIAGSFVWIIVALVVSIPLGLLLLKISENFIDNKDKFYAEINHDIALLYILFVVTCFLGVVLARIVAVSIKTLADNKLAQKTQK